MIPYLIMTFLYFVIAIVAALAASFSSWQLLPWFTGMVWLRIHFITLGILTQVVFGAMPILVAKEHNLPRPKIRWDIWLSLNAGIALLLIGIPLFNKVPIISGGTLVFTATTLLLIQLAGIRTQSEKMLAVMEGRKFYIAGLFYFLIGILVGTGMFTYWTEPLGIVGDIGEVHIHANNWGFMSLVFIGFFVDLYPKWAKRPLSNLKAITPIFWMMTVGAMGLVLSPWLASMTLAAIGALLHTSANIWLLVIAIKPLRGDKPAWTAGMAQMLVSYFWLFAPLSMAPFVIFGIESILPAKLLEATTPQALIYGWLLQFGYATVPYFFHRFFVGEEQAELGGTWLSFWLVNLGAIFLWLSIFIESSRGLLHGGAYILWTASFIPVLIDLWKKTKTGMAKAETAISHAE
ncbi:MAG: hypothetical protein HN736_01605 [Anaerolineae bacterium]|jgi:cytochrome c oxidase cbb3-type subunit I|nr:hypothetical protein [Anaerolineae bacterium]MBT4312166.1 hypothetical protein [Anaerolineae bacterium]MBT4459329.1 hypothetical protein [Anaerolineae bacterium]MBT4842777.1 hypothetical protein [Anaerolineae bacterium]MBT6060033.1 hypothetical protein [Anaerolineae bacterium]